VLIRDSLVAFCVICFDAAPTMLTVLVIIGLLGVLLFTVRHIDFSVCFFYVDGEVVLAAYFWPKLIIILLMIALTTFNLGNKEPS